MTTDTPIKKITIYEDVPLDQIVIGQGQARTRNVDKNIEDLARSIQTLGLLEPIVLARTGDEAYEVITGQRRFLAVQRLGWTSIMAGILDTRPDEDLSKAISLTENMVREDMVTLDYIDACTKLFLQYGSIKLVSEELGLPRNEVSQYVKFDQLVPALQERVNKEPTKLNVALRAQKAAAAINKEDEIDEATAVTLFEEMETLSGPQLSQLEKSAKQNPNASIEEIIESGRRQPREVRLTIVISVELQDALDRFASEEDTNRTNAAADIIEKKLIAEGYVKDEA